MSQIDSRRAALRLDANELAVLAGISIRTLRRMRADPDATRAGNFRKLSACLQAEEQRLLEHLISLHPERARELLSSQRGSRDGTGGAEGSDMARRAAGDGMDGEAAASGEAAPSPSAASGGSSLSPEGRGEESEAAA
ncbi:MAG: hypothetical protein U0942_16000 [Parvibaculum sp.]|uniref:hypothetical protein n=1 Tax=Parvibaculum sp. TaxID=2024848 RepID=UPI002ABB4D4D|nr:hypothetical protein [Parvibaculum sp.]MDZ4382835.1 hypothetical protein [Parvibaculum sp.]